MSTLDAKQNVIGRFKGIKLAYTLQALIAHRDVLQNATLALNYSIDLPQRFGMLPLTAKIRETLTLPFCPLTDGDGQLPFELIALCAAVSENGSVAYVEAEFFGGDGTQAAAIFKNGKELGPTFVATEAINGALAAIGVQRLNHKDEFDALELGRHRDTEKWLI
jgi:hypothetical protein